MLGETYEFYNLHIYRNKMHTNTNTHTKDPLL